MRAIVHLAVIGALGAWSPCVARAQPDLEPPPHLPTVPEGACPGAAAARATVYHPDDRPWPPECYAYTVHAEPYTYTVHAEPYAYTVHAEPVRNEAAPPPAGEANGADGDKDQVASRLSIWGAATSHAYMAGGSLAIDGEFVGVDASLEALAIEEVTGPLEGDGAGDPAALGSAHLTWAVASTPSVQLRVLTGGSMLALPENKFTKGQPWAKKTLYGPEAGAAVAFNPAGHVGVEGWGRVTPFPVRIVDVFAGLVLRNGPVGLTVGWRRVDVNGDGTEAPKMRFQGGQAGLSLRF